MSFSYKIDLWSLRNQIILINPFIAKHHSGRFNPFKPEITIVFFILYKPRIAAAILYL